MLLWSETIVWSEMIVWSDCMEWDFCMEMILWSETIVWSEMIVWSDCMEWDYCMERDDCMEWDEEDENIVFLERFRIRWWILFCRCSLFCIGEYIFLDLFYFLLLLLLPWRFMLLFL